MTRSPGTAQRCSTLPRAASACVISWEVFFGGRARDAIGHGGEILVNPTNGASYTGTLLQTQQINASRLRALETGRWVAQVAPTGFSAFIDDTGHLHARTSISERKVLQMDVRKRTGDTIYVRWGDRPIVALALLLVVIGLIGDRARASRSPARR